MTDRYSKMITEVALKVLAQYGEQGPAIWEIIAEDVIHDTISYMTDNNKYSLDQDSLTLIIGKIIFQRLSVMTPNQYQKLAMRTCSIRAAALRTQDGIAVSMLDNAMLGLCGEAGECADLVKKHIYQWHDLNKEHMAKELGDVAWYLAEASEGIGYSLEDILQMNIRKLEARYPKGHFDVESSRHRSENDI